MKEPLAAFAAPILTAFVLLYQVFASLQIALGHPSTLIVTASVLGVAVGAGLLAAAGSPLVRAAVLAVCAAVVIDVTTTVVDIFDYTEPKARARVTRDRQRVTDIHRIKAALDQYAATVGPLPAPLKYGENSGAADFWVDWWDVSATDGDGDGRPFLDFLVEGGILASVPVDPLNQPSANRDARNGKQYVYLVVPPGYGYAGGTCEDDSRGVYLLGVTDLETEPRRPPVNFPGSGCSCLWRQIPNFFQAHFDFVVCGTFKR
jgi:hypothetical protein